MDNKRFKEIDDEFICDVCGKKVEKLVYSSRDHCNHCLCSKHVDVNPGDRSENCRGVLRPIEIEKGKKDSIKIVYKCDKCGAIRKNTMANDDNYDRLLEIMKENSF